MDTVYFDVNHMPEPEKGLTLALGNFDGMHAGHQRLYVEASLHAKGLSAALLFDEPFGDGPYLSSLEDKLRYAHSSRLEAVYILRDAKSVYGFTAEEFIENVLKPLGTSTVVVGEDFRFGKNAQGTPALLKESFETVIVPLHRIDGEKVASRAIKAYLKEGQILKANAMLGRPYEIMGTVEPGLHNGAKIGYPTANVHTDFPYVLPFAGVYAGMIYLGGVAYRAMINVGTNPTIGALDTPLVEVHVLDYSGDCYGMRAYVRFLGFIREEKRFASLEELAEQLKEDERRIRSALA